MEPDVWIVALSAAAFTVSLISLYFSTFRKKVSMVGSLIAWRTNEPGQLHSECEFALANTGNQELLIREAGVEPIPWHDGELVPELEVKELPMVLNPGSIVTIKIPMAKLFMNDLYNDARMMRLEFQVYSPKAKLHLLRKELTPFVENGDIPKKDWKPFTLS